MLYSWVQAPFHVVVFPIYLPPASGLLLGPKSEGLSWEVENDRGKGEATSDRAWELTPPPTPNSTPYLSHSK